MKFDRYGVKENEPPHFHVGDGLGFLLAPQPPETWPAGWLEEGVEELFAAKVSRSQAFARGLFKHFISWHGATLHLVPRNNYDTNVSTCSGFSRGGLVW